MCSPSIFQQDLSCSSQQLETSPLPHSLGSEGCVGFCHTPGPCCAGCWMNTEPKVPAQPLFLLLVPDCSTGWTRRAVKENAVSRIPVLFTGNARKYEENEVGVLDRHGCPSSMFRWAQVDLRNQLCLHLDCSDSHQGC